MHFLFASYAGACTYLLAAFLNHKFSFDAYSSSLR